MTKQNVIASAYFASDDVIFAVRNDESSKGLRVDRLASAERKRPGHQANMEEDLNTALVGIQRLMKEGEALKAVVLICPGPFMTINKSDLEDYGKIGRNAEVKNWRQKNPKEAFRGLLLQAFGDEEGRKPVIYIYNQAGATAVGEYMRLYGDQIRHADSPGKLLKNIGSHLFVVADASIDAALITDGEPYHGLSTMNVGHHAVLPVGENPATLDNLQCAAHPGRPCLNSLASLNAVKRRWPGTHYEDFKASDDLEKLSLIAFYIAQMLANVTLTTTPAKIIIGGRIVDNPHMTNFIREHLVRLLQDHEWPEIYPGYPDLQTPDDFLQQQEDRDSGVKGGLHVLARVLVKDNNKDNIASFDAYKKGLFPL
ncbi:ROK family protein [Phaeobacter sp. 22II1-1F12B]|uniref:ROK family protein n=1 Tax=Phaeobacter sp. 22II1-1F12B TaxID=1317111 RepID=UPI000B528CE8|nr:ROK family protein [Phaeobacter sp. 22II1-1F12B]OWU68769.1 hypothetical protein ATO1_25030 [Phaeobacter sp. 22II1-1F12B]